MITLDRGCGARRGFKRTVVSFSQLRIRVVARLKGLSITRRRAGFDVISVSRPASVLSGLMVQARTWVVTGSESSGIGVTAP